MNISKIMLAAAIAAGLAGTVTAATTADYVQTGLIAFWDAIDNVGTGTHDPNSATWKNLVPGGMDLTLDNGVWADGNSLRGNGTLAAHGPATIDYLSIEIAFNNERTDPSIWLFGNGADKYCAVGMNATMWINRRGTSNFTRTKTGNHSLSWVNDKAAYTNGVAIAYGAINDTWNMGPAYVHIGARNGSYGFMGKYYAIRLYDHELTADEVLLNNALDKVRFFGADPATVALPQGFAFDSETNLVSARAAAPLVWRGTAGGRWDELANWSWNGADITYPPHPLDSVQIPSGATITVDAGQIFRVAAVEYAGASVSVGAYTGSGSWGVDVPWLAGSGTVRIGTPGADTAATWTGNGGADTRVTNPANWGAADNTVLPDISVGTLMASFPAGGTALLDSFAALKGASFSADSAFTFADSTKALAIGAGGIRTALDAKPTVTHTFNVPLVLTAQQEWFANTNATIDFMKPISFANPGDKLTITGAGAFNFHATGTFTNDIVVTGDRLSRRAARVRAYANNALGGSEGTFKMDLLYGSLVFSGGVTNSRTIETYCNLNDQDGGLYVTGASGVTNVFDAPFNHRLTNLHLYIGRGTTFVVNKQFYTQSACYVSHTGNGTEGIRWIVNAPLYIGDRFNWPNNAILELNAPTNRINGNTGWFAGTVNLNVPYALSHLNGSGGYTQCIPLNGTGILDLKGNDNGVGVIFTPRTNYGGTIRSENPATLHLVDDYLIANYDSGMVDANGNKISVPGYTNRVAFTGCVSLSKEGKYTNRLIKASSTYGNLTIAKGRLEMAPEGTWANASNLVVKGTGLFTLEEHPASAPAFGKHVVVRIEPGLDEQGANPQARIELLNTTIQRCAEFYVDDVRQSEGLWGSAAAAAANPSLRVHTAPFFTGTGLMQVYSGVGVTLIIR